MSGDLIARAKRRLEAGKASASTSQDIEALLARARAATAPRSEVQKALQSSAERVRLQMACGATGRAFVGIAERRGAVLQLIGYELTSQKTPGSGTSAGKLSGEYQIEHGKDYACPHCLSADGGWSCNCPEFSSTLHCGGSRGNLRYCACGRLEDRQFVEVDRIEVRGQSAASRLRSAPGKSSGARTTPLALPRR